ncbi:MAG: flagella basal body P-ring formation protein FlgA [Proteobacteria bacterium]|nr:flagella basal body P-ring formation protein FlgA [Pseudomonadota bacterium]NBX86411.1 flagella basal body P-ring formation protein FlgA [Pseudomonadota bacterium]
MKLINIPITLLLVFSAGSSWAEAPLPTISVPVLKQAVQKGQTIMPENIMLQATSAGSVFASTVTQPQQIEGLQAVRPLAAGQPISKLHLRVAPAIARNTAVVLRFSRGGIELTGSGTALEDGQVGQTIKVLNPATRSTLIGTVHANNIVEIN